MFRSIARRLLKLLLWLMIGSALLVLLLRWVPPPGTALMVERKIESWVDGQPIDLQRSWRPWRELPDHLKMAVIAAEDQKFAEHWGFDVAAIQAALEHNQQGGSLRGASTLSQQVAKNLFLWSGRSAFLRSTSTASNGATASSGRKRRRNTTSRSARPTCHASRPACWPPCCPTRGPGAPAAPVPRSAAAPPGFANRYGNWAAAITSTASSRNARAGGPENYRSGWGPTKAAPQHRARPLKAA